jgi:hypothetical protein
MNEQLWGTVEAATVSESLGTALPTRESHSVEFKQSLSLLLEGAQAIVAFANAHGGSLFFGIRDNGQPVGVDVGANTLERLADDLERHIYPYAPVAIGQHIASNGKTVVEVTVVADKPPVVGVYLYSSQQLDPDARVPASTLRAYRRVGRINRHVPDFMWLRPQLRSDPLMLIDCGSSTRGDVIPKALGGTAWLAEGSGMAHELRFRMDPELAPARGSVRDLPRSDKVRSVSFDFQLGQRDEPLLDGAWIIIDYQDGWGCLWESRRYVQFVDGHAHPTNGLVRRIIELPSKRGAA